MKIFLENWRISTTKRTINLFSVACRKLQMSAEYYLSQTGSLIDFNFDEIKVISCWLLLNLRARYMLFYFYSALINSSVIPLSVAYIQRHFSIFIGEFVSL